MDIFSIYTRINPYFRRRRFERFLSLLAPGSEDRILDVGGFPGTWTPHARCGKSIDIINLKTSEAHYAAVGTDHGISFREGNGCDLQMEDGSYDIIFSNSVIEHVGTYEDQKAFAREVSRVGKRLWVQTPAYGFPIEPHYIGLFIHWFPRRIQRRLIRSFTVGGVVSRLSQEEIDASVDEIRLLRLREMKELFPDCEILRERFLLIFTKSYIACRSEDA